MPRLGGDLDDRLGLGDVVHGRRGEGRLGQPVLVVRRCGLGLGRDAGLGGCGLLGSIRGDRRGRGGRRQGRRLALAPLGLLLLLLTGLEGRELGVDVLTRPEPREQVARPGLPGSRRRHDRIVVRGRGQDLGGDDGLRDVGDDVPLRLGLGRRDLRFDLRLDRRGLDTAAIVAPPSAAGSTAAGSSAKAASTAGSSPIHRPARPAGAAGSATSPDRNARRAAASNSSIGSSVVAPFPLA